MTIVHKLNVLRRIYAAVAAGLRADNPAAGIRAPRDRRAPEDFGSLSELEMPRATDDRGRITARTG
jgi:hypothetical protein